MKYNTSMLVGYTGFVGSNLSDKYDFTYRINTKNREDAFGKNPDLLVYAGLRAEKFLANNDPEADLKNIEEAFEQIKKIEPGKLVLISTVDVYKDPVGVDEDTKIDTDGLAAYGLNRYKLEQMIRSAYPDALIVRLPGLFGKGLKKNFIYDYIHVIPSMLKEAKYLELSVMSEKIKASYEKMDNGFYKCKASDDDSLKYEFKKAGFSALNFTDSRGIFQFYNLERLMSDIFTAIDKDIRLLNIATQPVSISEVYSELTGGEVFVNEISNNPPVYDYRSIHAEVFGGYGGYFYDKDTVLKEIKEFVSNK